MKSCLNCQNGMAMSTRLCVCTNSKVDSELFRKFAGHPQYERMLAKNCGKYQEK